MLSFLVVFKPSSAPGVNLCTQLYEWKAVAGENMDYIETHVGLNAAAKCQTASENDLQG